MIGVRYKNGLGKIVEHLFDNTRQAKQFCFYELANTGYELFYKKTKGGNIEQKIHNNRFARHRVVGIHF